MSVSGRVARDGYRIIPENIRQMEDLVKAIGGEVFKNGGCGTYRIRIVTPDAWKPDDADKEIFIITLMAAREIGNEGEPSKVKYKCPQDVGSALITFPLEGGFGEVSGALRLGLLSPFGMYGLLALSG